MYPNFIYGLWAWGRPMRIKILALIGISIIMIIVMILITDPNEMAEILGGTDLFLVFIVIVLYLANGFVKAFRWRMLVHSFEEDVSFLRLYLFLLIGLMINNTTPGRVGGEPVRAYLLRSKEDVPIGQGLSTVFVERIADLIVLTSMALIGIGLIIPILLTSDIGIELLILSFIPVIAIIIIFVYLATHPKIIKRLGLGLCGFLKKFTKKDWVNRAEKGLIMAVDSFSLGLIDMQKTLWEEKGKGVTFVGLTLLIWINEAARIYLILLALPGVEVPSFGAVLIASSVATVFGVALPIGALHATLITSVFAALGVDIASATTAGILIIMTSIWLSIPLGIIAMFIVGLKMDKARDEILKKENQEKDIAIKN